MELAVRLVVETNGRSAHAELSRLAPPPRGLLSPMFGTDGEIRTLTLRVLSAPPLPVGPRRHIWCARSGSNGHWTASQTVPSADWGTRARLVARMGADPIPPA